MSEVIVYVDQSRVLPGKLAELKVVMQELVEFVAANEPRILTYGVYFSPDGTRMTVLHIHSDPASLEFHMQVGGPEFPKAAPFIELETIDVYGRPGDEIVEQLKAKAAMLGNGRVTVHEQHEGVHRLVRQHQAG